ncbi:MAG: TetR/AcrR family transcriptional regulator [Pseudomonadota bacterium]
MPRITENMEKRRQRILTAAESLIRKTGEVDFNMQVLAETAEVSFATPFNQFGSKNGILLALLGARIDKELNRLRAVTGEPLERVLDLADHSTSVYLADTDLYRPILRSVQTAGFKPFPEQAENVFELWALALDGVSTSNLLADNVNLQDVSRSLHFAYASALLQWAMGNLADEEFREQARFLVIGSLLRWLTPDARRQLLAVIERRIQPKL